MFTKSNLKKVKNCLLKKYSQFEGFEILTLKDFLRLYSKELGYDFQVKKRNTNTPYDIICLVDCRKKITSTMSPTRKKVCRKACRRHRNKLKKKYHYSNVFNRIHGFLSIEDQSNNDHIPEDNIVFSLSLICASSYSDKRGIGSYLMDTMIEVAKKSKYTDIILEIANEHTAKEESESEEDSEEDSEDESSEDEYDSDEELEISEINEDISERLASEFLRKTFRLRKEGNSISPYYNIEEEYIYDIICSYLNDEYDLENYFEYKFTPFNVNEPGEFDYGGYYYNKGKDSQIGLFRFYEKFGFKEDGTLNYEWKAFTTDPFPCMILTL